MSKEKPFKPKKYHIPGKYRDSFTGNLALLLNAAVPVQEALVSLQETTKYKPLIKALDQMKRDIDEGISLGSAMDRAGIVSAQTLALVQLGEQSGRLVENMRVAARQEEKQHMFQAKVRSALLYPAFVMGLTLIIGLAVAWFLLPKLSVTFTQLDVKLPLISKIFIGVGIFLKSNGWWAVPIGLTLLATVLYMLFGNPKTRHLGQRLLFRLPGISRLMHEVEIARFGYLLGTLLQAGLTVTESLASLGRASQAPLYKKLYAYLGSAVEDGYSFKTAFPKFKHMAKAIPPSVQQMVIAGERSGSLPETLLSVGAIYEEKADISTQNLEAILEPILLIIVWLGVMGVAVAVIMPIYGLVGGLNGT